MNFRFSFFCKKLYQGEVSHSNSFGIFRNKKENTNQSRKISKEQNATIERIIFDFKFCGAKMLKHFQLNHEFEERKSFKEKEIFETLVEINLSSACKIFVKEYFPSTGFE